MTKYDNSSYTYDANGNRISQNDVRYTYDASGNLITDSNHEYVYGPNGLIGYYQNDKFYTNVYNNRGDVTKILDESSDTVSSISYGDYGNITSKTGDVNTPFLYAGQGGAVTDNNGLVYLKTRYYNPELMRFMNRDTVSGSITEPQSLNRYTYVQGNPLTYVDLTGQSRTFVTVGNVLWFSAGFAPVAGSITAVVDLLNDLSQAPVDNTTVMLDMIGIGAGLVGGRGVENSVSQVRNTEKIASIIPALRENWNQTVRGFNRTFGRELETAGTNSNAINSTEDVIKSDNRMFQNQHSNSTNKQTKDFTANDYINSEHQSGKNTTFNKIHFTGNRKNSKLDRDVYQRDDIIFSEENITRMKKGKAPLDEKGNPYELHHINQEEPSSMIEVRKDIHHDNYYDFHTNDSQYTSWRKTNPMGQKDYNSFRPKYWKQRIADYLKE